MIKQFVTYFIRPGTLKNVFGPKFCLSMVIRTWDMGIPTFDSVYFFL